jgi:sRNA-binding protein
MDDAREAAAETGWSLPYTLGVLARWKMAAVYCQAVLSHDQRIGLDGSLAEMVDVEAKELATKQIAQLEARKAATKAAEVAAAAMVKPKPARTQNSRWKQGHDFREPQRRSSVVRALREKIRCLDYAGGYYRCRALRAA